MDNELQVFTYEGNEVRTVQRDGETWWVLKDVCDVFGETDHKRAKQRLDGDEVGGASVPHPQNPEKSIEVSVVNESGLYSLLFAMQPEKARGVSDEYIAERQTKLKAFKRWVTHEVLPSIRKHGAYMTAPTIDKILADPDFGIRLLTELKAEQVRNATLAAENDEMAVRLNESEKFWTIMKFNQHFNRHWDMKACQRNGKAASAYSRQHGYEVRRCQTNDDRFEFTNSYAYEVLETLFLGA
jgi:prophage antirepressor-like protein